MEQGDFEIVSCSSVWRDSEAFSAAYTKDPYLRLGIIKKVQQNPQTKELNYLVEVKNKNDPTPINCVMLRSSGGAFNYDDTVLRGYKYDDNPETDMPYSKRAGDVVLVGCFNGEAREGVILGFISHPARKITLDASKGPQFVSEFNGVETSINESGEYKLTYKALPTNLNKLLDKSGTTVPAPTYDAKVGGSHLKFDKTGGFTITDAAQENPQRLNIDKAAGTFTINSGKISITLTKKNENISVKSKVLDIVSETSFNLKTKDASIEASKTLKLKSPKVAIGTGGTELLDQISKLVDGIGNMIIQTPMGPCPTPISGMPGWTSVTSIKSKIDEIKGSL